MDALRLARDGFPISVDELNMEIRLSARCWRPEDVRISFFERRSK